MIKLKKLIEKILKKESFDPLSQGPNMVDPSGETNPYPAWNSQMRKLEEDDVAENEHGREAQMAGAGQFDPRTFGKL